MIAKRAKIIQIFPTCVPWWLLHCTVHVCWCVCATANFDHDEIVHNFMSHQRRSGRRKCKINTFAMPKCAKRMTENGREGEKDSERKMRNRLVRAFLFFLSFCRCVVAHIRTENKRYGLQSIVRNEFQRCIDLVFLFYPFVRSLGLKITFTRLRYRTYSQFECISNDHRYYTRIGALIQNTAHEIDFE